MKKVRQIICGFGWLLVAAFVMAGCQSTPPPSFSSGFDINDPMFSSDPLTGGGGGGGGGTNKVVFKSEDLVRITFIGPEGTVIPPFEGRISENGTITLPLIGTINAVGRTSAELENDIHDAYVPKYYLRLTVTVSGAERFYYVGGEVKLPNRYVLAGQISLTKAIQTAGDFTDWANKKKVTITRMDGSRVGPVNCVRILEGKIADPPVYSGDKIYVPRHW